MVHGPDGRVTLPTEYRARRGKIYHAIADVFEFLNAIVASAVTLVRRIRLFQNYAVSCVDADRIRILHQNRRAGCVFREEIVLVIEH